MKKFDNFANCLKVLKTADFAETRENEIYRTGVIAQFNLTFELAWKALQEVLRLHGTAGADTGLPVKSCSWALRSVSFPIHHHGC
ncbi:MAG: nucleotidyltransferase substrate binding protein [Succinimonas sp.]|nr:nucleotidyltransferase substrate binding protein [Succinimonas sp.]